MILNLSAVFGDIEVMFSQLAIYAIIVLWYKNGVDLIQKNKVMMHQKSNGFTVTDSHFVQVHKTAVVDHPK